MQCNTAWKFHVHTFSEKYSICMSYCKTFGSGLWINYFETIMKYAKYIYLAIPISEFSVTKEILVTRSKHNTRGFGFRAHLLNFLTYGKCSPKIPILILMYYYTRTIMYLHINLYFLLSLWFIVASYVLMLNHVVSTLVLQYSVHINT